MLACRFVFYVALFRHDLSSQWTSCNMFKGIELQVVAATCFTAAQRTDDTCSSMGLDISFGHSNALPGGTQLSLAAASAM